MNAIEIFFISIVISVLYYVIWGSICNNKTYKQRTVLLNRVHAKYSGTVRLYEWYSEIDRVSYDAHFYELIWFRDPWKLYSNQIQELVK